MLETRKRPYFLGCSEAIVACDQNVTECMQFYKEKLGFSGVVVPELPPILFARLYRDDASVIIYNVDEYVRVASGKKRDLEATVLPKLTVSMPLLGLRELRAELLRHGLQVGEPYPAGDQEWQLKLTDPCGGTLIFSERDMDNAG